MDPPFANVGWLVECSYPEPAALASNFLRIFFLNATLRQIHDFIVARIKCCRTFCACSYFTKTLLYFSHFIHGLF